MIKMLGGAPRAPQAGQAQDRHPAPTPVYSPMEGYHTPATGDYHAPPPPQYRPEPPPQQYRPEPAPQYRAEPPAYPGQPYPPPSAPGQPYPPPPALSPTTDPARPLAPSPFDRNEDDEAGKTRFIAGVNIDKLNIPRHVNTLQILGSNGQWYDWGPIHAKGMNVGRAKSSADFPGLNSMAVRHMKFSYNRASLMVEDMGSINGVFVQVTSPLELADGMRFRVGSQRIEFHRPEGFDSVTPLVAEDGEEFCGGDLVPLAFLDLIRPNGKPGLRFPITKPGVTVIGREGSAVDIALTGDNAVSGMHAQIRQQDGTFHLEDLRSRNGTFVQIFDPYVVKSGDVILAGRVLFRVVDQAGG